MSDTPRLDAELLLAHTLGISREAMILGNHPVPDGFAALVARRLNHEPVAFITGTRDFWTITLDVSPAVLIPRPDSETLIEAAVTHFDDRGPARILDLGTGSGALLLAALDQWPSATGLGIDASPLALAVAAANAARIAPGRAVMQLGDWATGIDEKFDLILCNPPYVEDAAKLAAEVADHEPHGALFAGADGLDAYRTLIPQLRRIVAANGIVVLEIGSTQAAAVMAMAHDAGWAATVHRDLAMRERCLMLL